jgi:hypothetical protein
MMRLEITWQRFKNDQVQVKEFEIHSNSIEVKSNFEKKKLAKNQGVTNLPPLG